MGAAGTRMQADAPLHRRAQGRKRKNCLQQRVDQGGEKPQPHQHRHDQTGDAGCRFMLFVFHAVSPRIPGSVRDVVQRVGAGAVDPQFQMQVVAGGVAGGTHIPKDIPLGDRLAHAD